MAKLALINLAEVDLKILQDIVEAADLPPGEVRIIIGDPLLSTDFQGMTIARALIGNAANIYGLEDHLDEKWDCGVLIGPKWAHRQPEYPIYFAYLLGHELGHAHTVLTDLTLVVYEEFLVRFIGRASGRRVSRWDELPHEIRYDQFAIAVAEKMYGRDQVEAELSALVAQGVCDDAPRVRKLLSVAPRLNLNGLRQELAEFSLPYQDELVALWDEERKRGRLGVASGLRELSWLWADTTR